MINVCVVKCIIKQGFLIVRCNSFTAITRIAQRLFNGLAATKEKNTIREPSFSFDNTSNEFQVPVPHQLVIEYKLHERQPPRRRPRVTVISTGLYTHAPSTKTSSLLHTYYYSKMNEYILLIISTISK